MRPAVLALLLPCLMIALPAYPQDANKESPLEGWRVAVGEWQKEKDGAGCQTGYCGLEWEGEAKDTVQIQLYVTVREWTGTGGHEVGFTWDAGDPRKSRNGVVITPTQIRIFNNADGDKTTLVSFSAPFNRPIPMKAKISKKGVQVIVGREKCEALLPSSNLGRLRLWANGASAVFSKVKVKTK